MQLLWWIAHQQAWWWWFTWGLCSLECCSEAKRLEWELMRREGPSHRPAPPGWHLLAGMCVRSGSAPPSRLPRLSRNHVKGPCQHTGSWEIQMVVFWAAKFGEAWNSVIDVWFSPQLCFLIWEWRRFLSTGLIFFFFLKTHLLMHSVYITQSVN